MSTVVRPALSAAAARRIAVAAQGLGRRLPLDAAPKSRAAVTRAALAQGVLQIDSVNVLARAHYLPLFARLGAYPTEYLDDAVWPSAARRPRLLVESWAHMASMVPVDLHPLFWWRRRDLADGPWGARRLIDHPGLMDEVTAVITENGPISAGQVERLLESGRGPGGWWGWSATKIACEVLFASGVTATASRNGFERFYDLTERVLPAAVLAAPQPPEADAKRALVELAARRLGIATVADLADFFRMRVDETRSAADDLVAAGLLEPVSVDGWKAPAYLHVETPRPRRLDGAALLCPFDPLVWFRPRTERLFDFHYRIEIYTPAHKRVHGYYVMPLLMGDALVGRFDLKADRQAGVLLVQAAWAEPGATAEPGSAAEVGVRAMEELWRMAGWLGLDDVVVRERGNLPLPLAG